MTKKGLLLATVLVLIAGGSALAAEGGGQLVFTDGETMAVKTMALRGTFVEVTLPSGAIQRYEAEFVDLEASGLVTKADPEGEDSEAPTGPRGRFDDAIASGEENPDGVKITDQDVGHVRPDRRQDGDGAEAEDEAPAERTSLSVSDLKREQADGVMRVTGKVNNTGSVPVTSISITADAQKADGTSAGKGTTGLSQTLDPGGSAEFSIAIPVTERATNVRVGASAALVEFNFEEAPSPDTAEGE